MSDVTSELTPMTQHRPMRTPGLIVAGKSLLDHNPHPSRQEVKLALSGNFCRCTGYEQVIEAVLAAAEKMDGRHA